MDAAQIDGGALLFDDGTGTVNVDAGSDGTGAVLDGVDVIGHSGDAIQVVDGVDLTLSGGTFIGNAALWIDAGSMVEITGVLGAVFAGVNVVDDNMLQVDTGSTLVLGGGRTSAVMARSPTSARSVSTVACSLAPKFPSRAARSR